MNVGIYTVDQDVSSHPDAGCAGFSTVIPLVTLLSGIQPSRTATRRSRQRRSVPSAWRVAQGRAQLTLRAAGGTTTDPPQPSDSTRLHPARVASSRAACAAARRCSTLAKRATPRVAQPNEAVIA